MPAVRAPRLIAIGFPTPSRVVRPANNHMAHQINKAVKRQRGAGIDIREATYLVGGYRQKSAAKKNHKRAQRRLDKALVQEQRDSR